MLIYSGPEVNESYLQSKGCEFKPRPKLCVVFLHKYIFKYSETSFEKNCFSAWASTLNMGLINKVDMVCLSPVGYGV